MVAVHMSDRLRRTIERNVSSLFDERLKLANVVPAHWFDMIYAGLMPMGHLSTLNTLPTGYFKQRNTFIIYGLDVNGRTGPNISVIRATKVLAPRCFDAKVSGVVGNNSSSHITLDLTDPRWKDFYAEYADWVRNIRAIQEERDAALGNVRKVLTAYRTLAPMLKAFPAMWELLPSDVKDKHNAVAPTKDKKAADLPSADELSDLSVQLAIKRMGAKGPS